jgi:hypothetical protein
MPRSEKLDRVFALVHEIDDMKAERSKLTAALDERIASKESELAALVDGKVPPASNSSTVEPGSVVRRGRPGSGFGDRIVALLAEQPGVGIGDLAKGTYGADNARNRHRVRAQLSMMRERGRVRRTGPGVWQPVDVEEEAISA